VQRLEGECILGELAHKLRGGTLVTSAHLVCERGRSKVGAHQGLKRAHQEELGCIQSSKGSHFKASQSKGKQRHSIERRAHQGKGHLCSKASRHKF
jgi:hypothetical protein